MTTQTTAKTIDWNGMWRRERGTATHWSDPEYWDTRAASFTRKASERAYADALLRLLNPQPDWTVLDVGCGGGTLTVPLAGLVRQVTAIDFSPKMIEVLGAQCREDEITNVDARVVSWEDDWRAQGIVPHDVVIASRSLIVDDLEAAMRKLNDFARQRACFTSSLEGSPADRAVIEAVGRRFEPSPDYIYPYNVLYTMGIYANISIIENRIAKVFANLEMAVDACRWMVPDITPVEEQRLRDYVSSHLVAAPGGLKLDYERVVRWALVSWTV